MIVPTGPSAPVADAKGGWTEGPWVVQSSDTNGELFVVAGAYPYGSTICVLEDEPREGSRAANARLMAAAPDMLAYVREWADTGDPLAKALIRLATGGARA